MYSIQSIEAYKMAIQKGFLQSNKKYQMDHISYNWMGKQMEKRLNGYSFDNGIIWLWKDKPKNMYKWTGETGTKMVLLEIEVNEEEVLLSNFEFWSCMIFDLNNGTSKEDFYEFYGYKMEDVFEMRSLKGFGNTIQGTTGKIVIEQIKKLKFFICR
ncbi:MAG: DUF3841 domain-containing protein [Clostridia bacterium]|nr:DUF3841 domain-containing protein [Clostridia bacterium]